MLKVSELYIYPVKSLGGIKVDRAIVTDRGFEHDRRWMLIDKTNRFLSQREIAKMALFNTAINSDGILVNYRPDNRSILIPYQPLTDQFTDVTVWDDTCTGQLVNPDADRWFADILNIDCRLVYMPEETMRFTSPKYTPADSVTSFSDAYPFMTIGQASLDDLNSKLHQPVPINRFRPNIVFTGGEPYEEDLIDELLINNLKFKGVKLCARCNIPTIDQQTLAKSKEPTRTMLTYRRRNNDVYLGQNLICNGTGSISVGDELKVLSTHTDERFFI